MWQGPVWDPGRDTGWSRWSAWEPPLGLGGHEPLCGMTKVPSVATWGPSREALASWCDAPWVRSNPLRCTWQSASGNIFSSL